MIYNCVKGDINCVNMPYFLTPIFTSTNNNHETNSIYVVLRIATRRLCQL